MFESDLVILDRLLIKYHILTGDGTIVGFNIFKFMIPSDGHEGSCSVGGPSAGEMPSPAFPVSTDEPFVTLILACASCMWLLGAAVVDAVAGTSSDACAKPFLRWNEGERVA